MTDTLQLSGASTGDPIEQALLAVLAHFELSMSGPALRSRVAKLPGAWSWSDLQEACESLSLQCERDDFDVAGAHWVSFPSVMPLREGGAAVVLSAQGEQVTAWVSGRGRVTLSAHELAAQSNGTVYLVRKRVSEHGAEDGPQGRFGHWFWGPLLQARSLYVQVGIAALLANLFAVTTSIFSMIVYDRVIPNNALDTLIALLVGAVTVFVCDFVIRTLRGYFLDVAGTRADMVVGDALFEQLLDMEMSARKGSTGAVANVLKEFESLREFLTSTTLVTLIDIPFSILFLIIIWMIGGPMVIVPLLAIPLMVGAGLFVQPRLRRLVSASQEDGHRKHSVLIETLGGLETIKAIGAGPMMRRRWQEAVTHQSELGLRQRMWGQFAANVANLAQQLVQVGVVTVGFFLVNENRIGFGAIIACTILSGRAISPLAQLTQLLTRVNQSLASYRSLTRLMEQPREHQASRVFMARDRLQGRIEFRDVTFTYPGASRPSLEKVSFTIEAGERVALLGKIGSGKTTIAKLLLGLYRPDSGAVLIDGVDVRQIDPADLRRHVGSVMQDVWLMAGTVRQNIALGSDDATDAQVLEAARVSGVEDFISQHPHGYSLKVSERGEGLSGGQRQSICIARALVGQPPVLLFDEPTSAMDLAAEQTLVQRLQNSLQQQTFVVITHKTSMMALVSKVIVLDQGHIVFQGDPAQLQKAGTR
jgi:ATP-binding cassette subfamily C protein LapB